jgi:hypothetical protein
MYLHHPLPKVITKSIELLDFIPVNSQTPIL